MGKWVLAAIWITGCAALADTSGTRAPAVNSMDCESRLSSGFTTDFSDFMQSRGFVVDHPVWNGFGGRAGEGGKSKYIPTVFIHGNSDLALGHARGKGVFTGWRSYLIQTKFKGLGSPDLYGVSWGSGDPDQAAYQTHDIRNLKRIRHFIELVLEYTGSERVNVVAHSMGVTLALKSILGGKVYDNLGFWSADLGEPIASRVENFVGIAGAVGGLRSCLIYPHIPACSGTTGLHPDSSLLGSIWEYGAPLALNLFSIWSVSEDEILGTSNEGENPSSRIPYQTGEFVQERGHFELKDQNVDLVFDLLYGRRDQK